MNNREESQTADKHTASQHKKALKHRHHPKAITQLQHNSTEQEKGADKAMQGKHSE